MSDTRKHAAPKRISRREALKRTGQVGLSSSVVGGLLAAGGIGAVAQAQGFSGLPALARQDVTELEFSTFYTGADGPIMQSIVDRYNQANPNVRINFTAPAHGTDYVTALQTASLSGNPPPIVAVHNYEIPPLAQYLYEIDPAALGLTPENFVDVAWQLPTYEGRLYGLTMSTGTMGLFYNKTHFEEAGLDPARPPTNQDEFIQAAQALTRDGRYGFALDPDTWMPWLTFNWQNGGGLLSEDGTQALFDTGAAIAAAQLQQDLVQTHQVAVPEVVPGADITTLLYSGNVSMLFLGPWNLNAVITSNQEEGTNLGWAKYPAFFDAQPAVQSTSHIYSLMRQNPENPTARDLGSEFIAWLLQEGSVEWAQAQAPTNESVLSEMATSDNPVVQGMTMWVEQAEYAQFPPYHPRWNEVFRSLTEAMQAITYQGADVASTMSQVTAQANDVLARG